LDHLQLDQPATSVRGAMKEVLAEGKVKTRDMGGNSSTSQVGDAVTQRLK